MCISNLAWVLALLLGLTSMPTILIAEPAPANTVAENPPTKRQTGDATCRYTGQPCSTGCGTFADKSLCAEYVCVHGSWNFSGLCLKSVCSPKSC
jgi:hypothetical protein